MVVIHPMYGNKTVSTTGTEQSKYVRVSIGIYVQ